MERILIGEGDGPIETWHAEFDEPLSQINSVLLDADACDLPVNWDVVLEGSLGWSEFEAQGDSCDSERLVAARPGVYVESGLPEGDQPGQGYYTTVWVDPPQYPYVLGAMKHVALALMHWWEASRNEADVPRQQEDGVKRANEKLKPIKAELAKVTDEAIQQKASEIADRIRECYRGNADSWLEIGPYLVKPGYAIYLIISNSMGYMTYKGTVWEAIANLLIAEALPVIKASEKYAPGTPRIPSFAGQGRKSVTGWHQEVSLISAIDTLYAEDVERTRREYLEWVYRFRR